MKFVGIPGLGPCAALCLAIAALAAPAVAETAAPPTARPPAPMAAAMSGRNIFYLGLGAAAQASPTRSDATPFSIGFLHQVAARPMMIGFDLGGEGTSLDSTWGRSNVPLQGMSFNLLLGTNVVDNGRFKADVAVLAGLRQSAASCAPSFLGYRCYADTSPDVSYEANFGGVITLSMDQFTFGLRATGESTQIVAGVRF